MYSHTLTLTLDSQKSDSEGNNWIWIRYGYNQAYKRKRTDYKVNKKHWDNKLSMIDRNFQDEYPQEMIDGLYDIKKHLGEWT